MESVSLLSSFLKMVFALSIVLGVMVLAAYFFRKFLNKPIMGGDDGALINIVATRYLGPKSSIMLVDVLGELIVVGVTNNQMSFLTNISDTEARQKLDDTKNRPEPPAPKLMDQFLRYKDALKTMKSTGKGR